MLKPLRPLTRSNVLRYASRGYATVSSSSPIVNRPATRTPPVELLPNNIPFELDNCILSAVRSSKHPLSSLVQQYLDNAGHVLDASLKYESRPSSSRRLNTLDHTTRNPMVVVAHCIQDGNEYKITISSGFALETSSQSEGRVLVLTCAHTFEEASKLLPVELQSYLQSYQSGTFVITGTRDSINAHPVTAIPSALPRSDLMALSCTVPSVQTIPVSPYPVQPNTPIRAHFVSHVKPNEPGWSRWLGGTWNKWVQGTVLGYRDFAGRETIPGTYDTLNHLLFKPLPTAGSSGGPIIDEESGAVIGVMLGTRMDNRVEGTRGWGVPSETIFEMFSLPGLEGKK
ncbi:hypothetical protein K435DRAFT_667546 [Dendrothele bispora CBS 962.96]|uniref:Trypsin-like serine protease n=1 Tax=Dendrothele bispora (strain CBS 962.96) TaxID=1314807 RepID=A0A4S8LRK6_DENBC|nr:hypothetical protein K435DRAFT_673742 [Dendrothele bispora CBS 962.96]THU94871.1 hypothetical protein K435DRAFT_667546 [Dendrothele bispora CBS 962.96]